MSKNKQKSRTELEHFRGLVKKLKSENRNLKKRLKELEKRQHIFDSHTNDEIIDIPDKPDTCPKCGKGELSTTDFKYVFITRCNVCDFIERRHAQKKSTKTV